MTNLADKASTGVKWVTLAKFINIGVGILRISILTRFLDKADFGLMAIVYFIVGFADLFMDMGVSTAILHKQNINEKEYSSLYWLNFMVSILLYIIAVLAAPWVASYYKEPELSLLVPLVAINFILSAIGRQFNIVYQKELNFYVITVIEIIAVVFSLIVAVVLAIYGLGVYALAYSTIAQFAVYNLLFLYLGFKRNRVRFHFSLKETYPFLRIGVYQMGGQIINYCSKELDVLIIGKMLGAEQLGIYNLAKQLAVKPIAFINPIITEVASPVLAIMQNSKEQLKDSYVKLIKMTSSVNLVIYLLMFVFSDLLIRVMYGAHYEQCAVILRLFCVYMYLRSINNPVGSLLIATGRTDLDLKWNIFMLFITAFMLYLGSMFDVIGILISLNVLLIIVFVPAWYVFYKGLINLPLKDYVKAVLVSPSDYKQLFHLFKKHFLLKKPVDTPPQY